MIAVTFPGQGSQAQGMGCDLYAASETARLTYDEASAVLGYDLTELCRVGTTADLARTEVTQPALLTHSIAALRLLQEGGLVFDVALGHSLGEYSALVATGALGFDDAVRLVKVRGEAMADAAARNPGGMIAVLGLDEAAVDQLCAAVGQAWPANFNCPGQVVVSAAADRLDELEERARAAGARRAVRLTVAGAFHSPLVAPAADALRGPLQATDFAEPAPAFLSTCSVEYEVEDFDELLTRQLVSPVRFEQSVRRLIDEGYNAFLEVGPGNVLSGLVKRIDPAAAVGVVGDLESLDRTLDGSWARSGEGQS